MRGFCLLYWSGTNTKDVEGIHLDVFCLRDITDENSEEPKAEFFWMNHESRRIKYPAAMIYYASHETEICRGVSGQCMCLQILQQK